MKKILILHQKHGNVFYDVSTKEMEDKAFLHIAKNRISDGFWYHKLEEPNVPSFLEDEEELLKLIKKYAYYPEELLRKYQDDIERVIAKVPKEFQKEVMKQVHILGRKLRHYDQNKYMSDLIEKIKTSDDVGAAKELINLRQDHEYESYYMQRVEEVE